MNNYEKIKLEIEAIRCGLCEGSGVLSGDLTNRACPRCQGSGLARKNGKPLFAVLRIDDNLGGMPT